MAPLDVTMMTLDMSSPATLSGTEPDSDWPSPPGPIVRVIVKVMRSPSPLVMIAPDDRALRM